MFKYPEDRLPVAIILLMSALDFIVYFTVNSFVVFFIYWLLMMIPKGAICAWNHHHQHTMTFDSEILNRILEFFYALHTGVTTNLWVLHHVLGHHKNYLDQTKDESRWCRKDGTTMGELEYTLNVTATAYYRGFIVGLRYPKVQRKFLLWTAITFTALVALTWYKPMAALFVFILPMVCSLLITSWTTYEHHSDLHTDNEYEASFNNTNRWYNILTGNLGYHTAHHHKQGLHWSKLPQLHDKIKDKIPENLYRDYVFNGVNI